ncbi:MAG: hypothetical protein ACWA45_09015 [Flavobacteriales bacterium]
MSNLVSILLGLVLSFFPSDNFQNNHEIVSQCSQNSHQNEAVQDIQNLKPEYLISKEELALSIWEEQKKEIYEN